MFTDRLDEEDRKVLYETAAEGAALLDSVGKPWWLSHGTLLGAWRHHGVIPWDDDLDMAFPRAHARKLQAAALAQGWAYVRIGPFCAKIWNPARAKYRFNRPWTWPFIDIALYDEFRTRIIIEHQYHSAFKVFKRDDLLPTIPYTFGPLQLPIPRGTKRMLDQLYPYWCTRPVSSTLCHRREEPYAEPSEQISIRQLAERFELFNIPQASIDPQAAIYFGWHTDWSGPLHFFPNGRMCRPGIDEGSYELVEQQYLVIRWDRWNPDALVWQKTDGTYRDLTKPFVLKRLTDGVVDGSSSRPA